jgi:hypothetical protein
MIRDTKSVMVCQDNNPSTVAWKTAAQKMAYLLVAVLLVRLFA